MASSLSEFKLERYFARYEFNTEYLLCCSDVEALSMADLLAMADEQCKDLWNNLKLTYTESEGHPLLRAEAAKLHGVNFEDTLVIVPQEGIYIAMHSLVDYLKSKHDGSFHAIATYPAYQSLYENLKSMNCDLDYWTVKSDPDSDQLEWNFSMDDLLKLLKTSTRLLVVNFPHNPTGYIPSREKWDQIVNVCKERGIFLFSDEMYRLSNNDGAPPLTSACAIDGLDAMTLCGMSKTFALPGLRMGWLCTKNKEVMKKMGAMKDYITICSPGPSEILSIIGLRNYQTIVERTLEIIHKNLIILDKFFKKHEDIFTWRRPTACTTGFVQLKSWLLEFNGGGATGFCEALVKSHKVLLLPGTMYDFSDDYVRFSFGRRNMPEAVKQLESFIEQNRPQKG